MRVLRVPLALVPGGLLALAMFYTLWSFVDVQMDFGDVVAPTPLEYKRLKVDTPVVTKRAEKVERTPPPTVVEPPRISVGSTNVENVVHVGRPTVGDTTIKLQDLGTGIDRDAIPIVRIEPVYPARAIARQTEGWVRVQFTIAANGSVLNPFVVAADPPDVFDDAALVAIARWRYQPRVENGVAVERVGMQTVIRFELADE